MKSIFPAIAAALAISMAAPAFAEGPVGKGRMFKEADTNGDGVISQAEHSAFSAQRSAEMFSRMDANGDGEITNEEIRAAKEKKHDRGRRHRNDKEG